ncbi:MAG: WbqC family protein [Saprospiraceae bacterium]|nr:WbqC family protein [Saprospiraceae bacterium]
MRNSELKVAVHQPNFLPWAGYFLKIAAGDIFVFHDNVQLTKSGPTRRVRIHAESPAQNFRWLTVPLKKHSDYALIKDLEISDEVDWRTKHLNTINAVYRKYPYFHEIYPLVKIWYEQTYSYGLLSKMNGFLIQQISQLAGLDTQFIWSSELPVSGKGSEYNLNIVKYLGGTHYLCGTGSKKYQDDSLFESQNIRIIQSDYMSELRKRLPDAASYFNPTHSIIELLMSTGITNTVKLMTNPPI